VAGTLGVALGEPIPDDAVRTLHAGCRGLVDTGSIAAADCTVLRYVDGRAFALLTFSDGRAPVADRPAPVGPSAWPAPELPELLRAKHAEGDRRFEAGDAAGLAESFEPGYLTWAAPELDAFARRLAALVPGHRDALIELVLTASDAAVRAEAATLLNWAGAFDDTAGRVAPALADPDLIVRNNVSRYLLYTAELLQDDDVLRAVAEQLAAQLRRPDMADRNKAVFGLTALARSEPGDRSWLADLVAPEARRLAARSILPNVGGVAAELLVELDLAPPRPPADAVASKESYDATLLAVVEEYLAAFSAHDVPGLMALADPDIRVYYADEAGVAALGTDGARALEAELHAYFEQLPTVGSELQEPIARAPFVWFRERVHWAEGSKNQASEAVYEIRKGKVVRAIYSPADR